MCLMSLCVIIALDTRNWVLGLFLYAWIGGMTMDDETREDVREEATEETNVESVEQREDDYQGLARRLDDLMRAVADMGESMRTALDAINQRLEVNAGILVDSGAGFAPTVGDAVADVVSDAIEEVTNGLVSIDDLDLM